MTDQPDLDFTPPPEVLEDARKSAEDALKCDTPELREKYREGMLSRSRIDWHEPQAHARTSHPATAHAAAASVSNFTAVETGILETLSEYGPMRDEKLIEKFREYGRAELFTDSAQENADSPKAICGQTERAEGEADSETGNQRRPFRTRRIYQANS